MDYERGRERNNPVNGLFHREKNQRDRAATQKNGLQNNGGQNDLEHFKEEIILPYIIMQKTTLLNFFTKGVARSNVQKKQEIKKRCF